MTLARRAACLLASAWLAGCATQPAPVPDEYDYPEPSGVAAAPEPAPMVEYPPVEPVEPPPEAAEEKAVAPRPAEAARAAVHEPVPAVAPAPAPATPSPAATTVASAPESASAHTLPPPRNVVPVPEISPEEQQLNALLADLHRYGSLPAEDARRELAAMTQQLGKQRTDANRIRLAMLYTVTRTGPQDDLRALQLLDNVAKSGPGSPAVKELAIVLHVQITERVRAVRDEQQKADAAIQKLEALRAMERSLLRDRVRGGGGGGTGGSSGGGGAGGGGAGAGGG